jgi:hypothetical protein
MTSGGKPISHRSLSFLEEKKNDVSPTYLEAAKFIVWRSFTMYQPNKGSNHFT